MIDFSTIDSRQSTIPHWLEKIIVCTLQLLLVVFLFIIVPGIGGTIDTHYFLQGSIVKEKGKLFTIEDTSGNRWEFEGGKFECGDKVKVLMFTNYTDRDREDDEIIKVFKIKK